jgi:hypothetical protein
MHAVRVCIYFSKTRSSMQIEQFRVKFVPCGYAAAAALSSARGNIYADAANPHVW